MAAFNFDGSSVLHGPVTATQTVQVGQNLTVSGSIINAEFQTAAAQAAAAQPGFTTLSPLSMTLDLQSGEFKLGVDIPPSVLRFELPHNHDTWVKLSTLSGLSNGWTSVCWPCHHGGV